MQEFDIVIKDKKGLENAMADHLSCLEFHDKSSAPISETFPDEHLFGVASCHWYANIANYIATGKLPSHWSAQDTGRFLFEVSRYMFDDPY